VRAQEIQRSNLAGTWYPADPDELRAEVNRCLGGQRGEDGELGAMIVPHAGYRYSGPAAGAGFAKLAPGRWRRAVVVAPSHYHAFDGAAVFPGSGFATPLGVVRVDREGTGALMQSPLFAADARPYAREHSLEIELPFLQVVDPALQVVPVLVGSHDDAAQLAALGRALGALDDRETLFVVSSDFTHYGAQFGYLPFPPDGPESVAAELRRLDFGAIEPIRRLDAEGFASYVAATGITVCGRGPITAFLYAANRRLAGELLEYYTSLDVTGDYEHSVSYAAIGFRAAPGAAG
jgi:AmmeMemoRadiSam system protein B